MLLLMISECEKKHATLAFFSLMQASFREALATELRKHGLTAKAGSHECAARSPCLFSAHHLGCVSKGAELDVPDQSGCEILGALHKIKWENLRMLLSHKWPWWRHFRCFFVTFCASSFVHLFIEVGRSLETPRFLAEGQSLERGLLAWQRLREERELKMSPKKILNIFEHLLTRLELRPFRNSQEHRRKERI